MLQTTTTNHFVVVAFLACQRCMRYVGTLILIHYFVFVALHMAVLSRSMKESTLQRLPPWYAKMSLKSSISYFNIIFQIRLAIISGIFALAHLGCKTFLNQPDIQNLQYLHLELYLHDHITQYHRYNLQQ